MQTELVFVRKNATMSVAPEVSDIAVEVCEVLERKPHPNADRLDVITLKGWPVVVSKTVPLQVGDPVVFFPPDSMVSEELADRLGVKRYLTPVKNGEATRFRVKATRLRGVSSYGAIDFDVPENVSIGENVAALYAGPSQFAGLDQVNISVPRSLRGSGDVAIAVSIAGLSFNAVTVNIR